MYNKFFHWLILAIIVPSIAISSTKLSAVWGDVIEDDPLIENLISAPLMQRIKHIDQSGPVVLYGYTNNFSRYDHSIGVYMLLKKIGAPQHEKIAGLLHDVSHTAFSHVGDHLFYQANADKSYQDVVHLKFLAKHNIMSYLPHGLLKLEQLDPDLHEYQALEQDLPNLCADRIQYIAHTAYLLNKLTKAGVEAIINNLN
ncbi:MAG: HD domain-containing protein, partial [Pseudomonadota bacterium]